MSVNAQDMGVRHSGEFTHNDGLVVPHVFAWNIRLQPGANKISVTDGHGHTDSCIITHDLDPRLDGLIGMISTTPGLPAAFIDDGIVPDTGFYQGFDGNADNSIATLPKELVGCRWIATKRMSDPANKCDLGFHTGLKAAVTVYVLASPDSPVAPTLTGQGFKLTRMKGQWRDNKLDLGPYVVFAKRVEPGGPVSVPGATADYVILLKAAQ
jgi:hypothetical protein